MTDNNIFLASMGAPVPAWLVKILAAAKKAADDALPGADDGAAENSNK